jgi:hypothetical protein
MTVTYKNLEEHFTEATKTVAARPGNAEDRQIRLSFVGVTVKQ